MTGSTAETRGLGRTILAAAWMFGGRGLGLLWSLLVIKYLGISAFGQFAVGIAAASLIAIPLDAYYLVRSPRVDDEQFTVDRASRWWLGVVLFVAGLVVLPVWLPGGIALSKAGGDVYFNAQKSTSVRAGKPDTAFAFDTTRQGLSLLAGLVVVLLVDDPSLTLLSFVYVAAFLPFALLCVPLISGVRVELPERTRRTGSLMIEAIGGAAYSQGDIVLVGILASSTAAGYYSLASVVLWSATAVGQNYSMTFHEPMRAHQGHVDSGPPLKITALLAVGAGLAMAGAGAVMWVLDAERDLWLTFLILGAATTTRFFSTVFATVLALQSRDYVRMRMSVVGVAVKLVGIGVLCGLADLGGPGAAIAFVLADLVAFVWAYRALYAVRVPLTEEAR